MRICLICTEIFAWGKFGGFGRVTRAIGSELVKRNIDTYAVVPRQAGQKEYELLDGIKVYGFAKNNLQSIRKLLLECNADIYHSEEPSFITFMAMRALPGKIHLVTSRDPRNLSDWISELFYPSSSALQVISNFIFENNFLVSMSVRKSSKIYYTAKFLREKVMRKYRLGREAEFLPTPIAVPRKEIIKSKEPLICYIGRMDRRKRPELFFKLAKVFPEIKFIAAGKSRDINYEKYLRNKYSNLKNLEITGFSNQFESGKIFDILEKSWILVSPSVREGLPNAYLEAMSYKCAILSSVNPEKVVVKFGYHVMNDDFGSGLKILLENDNWKKKGENGQKYVLENYEFNKVIEQHIKIYENLLNEEVHDRLEAYTY